MTDRPLLGIALMLGFCLFAPLGDALAKLLGQTVPLAVLLLARFAVQALSLMPLVLWSGRAWRLNARTRKLAWIRTVLHILGIGLMFKSLQYLPLADAVAIAFVMPFIMLILGHCVLGETIGIRRVAACLVGFVGTLLVIQPAFNAVGWPALLPLGVALVFALFMLVTRFMAKDIDPLALQAVNGGMALCILIPLFAALALSGLASEDTVLVWPATPDLLMLLTIGLIGTFSHLLMTWALRYAPSATLAPMQYLEIPFAALVGWVVFADWPNPLASLGIAITIAAGVYIVMREGATQSAPTEAP